jgi:hypothetical protein
LKVKFNTKRFGLDGSESLIPGLDTLVNAAADSNIDYLVFGMPHRGRYVAINDSSFLLQQTHTHTHTPDSSFAYVHHLRVSLSQTLCSCQHHWQAIAGHVQRVRDGQANPGINRRGYWRRQVPSWYFANAQVGFWQNGMYCQSTHSHFAPFTTMTRLMVDLSLAIVYPYRFTCP